MKYGVFQKLTGRRDSCGQYFRRNDTVDFVGDGTVEKPTTENIAVDTEIMFPSYQRAEIEGCHLPGRHSVLKLYFVRISNGLIRSRCH